MKRIFEWLMGFSFLCLFTLLIFVISLIFDNITVSQLLMNFGEIAICGWALYFGIKFVEYYNNKILTNEVKDELKEEPIMIFEDKHN